MPCQPTSVSTPGSPASTTAKTAPTSSRSSRPTANAFSAQSATAIFVIPTAAGSSKAFGTICWDDLPNHHPFIELDAFVVMPNHVHGIICIVGNEPGSSASRRLTSRSIGAVVGSFESAVTRSINQLRPGAAVRLWQQNFHDHVIRNRQSMQKIRDYIVTNPLRRNDDSENLDGTGADDVEAFTRSLLLDDRVISEEGDAGVAAT